MQLATSNTISPSVNAELLPSEFSFPNNFSEVTRSLEKGSLTRLQSFANFRGQISVGNYLLPIQKFSLKRKENFVFIENFPVNSFPKIKIVLEEINSIFNVKEFLVNPSNRTVQGEVLYTRFFLLAVNEKKCSLNFKDINFAPFNFGFHLLPLKVVNEMNYRAKLFRKLRFLEEFFRIEFDIPEHITPNDAKQIEVLFRGITEGEFSITVDNSITVFNYKLSKRDLQNISIAEKREFSFQFDEDLLVLDRFFQTGKMVFEVKKGSIANPKSIQDLSENEIVERLRLNIFDNQVYHRFEKYFDPERLKKNEQKLEYFKQVLRRDEPEFLVALLDDPLAEIDENTAIEIVEGLLQYYDFPDRFSVLTPKFDQGKWDIPIALTYPNHEPIVLENAFVDVKTGKVKMKISFDNLLKKGLKKAKEVFSIA